MVDYSGSAPPAAGTFRAVRKFPPACSTTVPADSKLVSSSSGRSIAGDEEEMVAAKPAKPAKPAYAIAGGHSGHAGHAHGAAASAQQEAEGLGKPAGMQASHIGHVMLKPVDDHDHGSGGTKPGTGSSSNSSSSSSGDEEEGGVEEEVQPPRQKARAGDGGDEDVPHAVGHTMVKPVEVEAQAAAQAPAVGEVAAAAEEPAPSPAAAASMTSKAAAAMAALGKQLKPGKGKSPAPKANAAGAADSAEEALGGVPAPEAAQQPSKQQAAGSKAAQKAKLAPPPPPEQEADEERQQQEEREEVEAAEGKVMPPPEEEEEVREQMEQTGPLQKGTGRGAEVVDDVELLEEEEVAVESDEEETAGGEKPQGDGQEDEEGMAALAAAAEEEEEEEEQEAAAAAAEEEEEGEAWHPKNEQQALGHSSEIAATCRWVSPCIWVGCCFFVLLEGRHQRPRLLRPYPPSLLPPLGPLLPCACLPRSRPALDAGGAVLGRGAGLLEPAAVLAWARRRRLPPARPPAQCVTTRVDRRPPNVARSPLPAIFLDLLIQLLHCATDSCDVHPGECERITPMVNSIATHLVLLAAPRGRLMSSLCMHSSSGHVLEDL